MLAILYRWTFSPMHVLGGGGVLLLLAAVVYWRTGKDRPVSSLLLLFMRCGFIVALTWLLMGPSVQPRGTTVAGKPHLYIYVDTSRSMLTEDLQGQSRIRFTLQRWLSDRHIAELESAYNVHVFQFNSTTQPLTHQLMQLSDAELATGSQSRITEQIRAALVDLPAGQRGASVLVLSDGHDSQAEPLTSAATIARTRDIIVHTATMGGASVQRDLSLTAFAEQKFLVAKEPGRIIVNLRNMGFDQPSSILQVNDGENSSQQTIDFGDNRTMRVYLPVQQSKPGLYEYVVSLTPVEGEVETSNNRQRVFVEVTDEPFKVLVLEGEPFWDTKFLAQSLRGDASIALTHITQISPGKQAKVVTRSTDDTVARVPTTAEELAAFDVVILGRGMERMLTTKVAKLFPAYVQEHGGHIVFARGKAYDPATEIGSEIQQAFAVIEPVEWGDGVRHDQALLLTPTGKLAPCFAFGPLNITPDEALGALRGFHLMPAVLKEKVSAEVWARAGSTDGQAINDLPPAIVTMRPGRGTVVAILGEGLWRWAQLPPEHKQFDGMYDVFWSNLVRSLAMGGSFQPGDQVALELSATTVRLGQQVKITVATRIPPPTGFQPSITITGPDGQSQQPSLARMIGGTRQRATLTPTKTGVYTVTLNATPLQPSQQAKKFAVFDEDIERLDAGADPQAMQSLAELSGGVAFTADQADEWIDALERFEAARVTPTEPEYVWNKGIILCLLLGWISSEWLFRRKVGML